MGELNKNGIYTYAFIGPIIPKITDLENIFRKISGSTTEVWGEILNVRSGNWNDIQKCLQENFQEDFQYIKENVKREEYWDSVESEFSSKYNLSIAGFYRH